MDKDVVHTHTQEYFSATKKNEIMPIVIAWTNLESSMLSKTSQIKKDK